MSLPRLRVSERKRRETRKEHPKHGMIFRNRSDAGKRLADRLQEYANHQNGVVTGLLRGGVPVAFEIAKELHLPLDVLLVRKLGAPGQPELAMGAVAPGGIRVLDQQLIQRLGLTQEQLVERITAEEAELCRREQIFQDVRPQIHLQGKTVLVVDDGIATGASMMAAIQVLRAAGAKKILVAAPVAPFQALRDLSTLADQVIILKVTEHFPAVGFFYRDFQQISDEAVRDYLLRSAQQT